MSTATIERSAGIPVTIGVMSFAVGCGYSGKTDDLDGAVQAASEALRDLFNHPVVIRFNSDRESGGSWLKTNDNIASFHGNCEIGIGANLFDLAASLARHTHYYQRFHYREDRSDDIAAEMAQVRERWAELGYDLNGPNQQVIFTAYIKADYLRDPASFNPGPDARNVLYTYHRTLAEAVEHVRRMATDKPGEVTEALRLAAAERRAARITACEAALASLSKKQLLAVLRGIDFKYRRDLWSVESATKPTLRQCIVNAAADNEYTYDPAHHAGVK